MRLLLLSLLGITVVSGIIAPGYGGFGGGGGSSSYSSEEHHHGGRPHRPPRPHDDDPEPRCQRDWMTFQRPSGTWCIKVFYGPGTKYDADNACAAQGAVLTSLQNANERIQIANEGRVLNAQNGGGLSDVWIGATRKAECPYRTSCAPLDTFQWTDGSATGFDGFFWPGPEPNGVIYANWGQQNCMELHVSEADGVAARYGYPHGSLDDQHCQQTDRMYACGKAAR